MNREELLATPDEAWYADLFTKSEKTRFSKEEQEKIISQSMKAAKKVFQQYDAAIQLTGLESIVSKYGVKVVYNQLNTSNTVIAMYDNKAKQLIIFQSSLIELLQRMKANGLEDLLTEELLKNLILAHEIYHIIEMHEPDIYTFSKIEEKKVLGITVKNRVKTASEIGAFHFSKLVNELPYSPCFIGKIS